MSIEALLKQGIPRSLINQSVKVSEETITFECGGGDITSSKVIVFTSPLFGKRSAYVLPQSPLAVSMGEIVNGSRKPFIWLPDDLPFHVADPSKIH